MLERDSPQDPVEPGPETLGLPEFAQAAKGLHETFLRDILRILGIATR